MNTILCLLAAVLAVFVGVLLWATESPTQRIRRLRSYGWSLRRIAEHQDTTVYRVRKALAA